MFIDVSGVTTVIQIAISMITNTSARVVNEKAPRGMESEGVFPSPVGRDLGG